MNSCTCLDSCTTVCKHIHLVHMQNSSVCFEQDDSSNNNKEMVDWISCIKCSTPLAKRKMIIGERKRANPCEQMGAFSIVSLTRGGSGPRDYSFPFVDRSSVYMYLNTRNVPKWRTPPAHAQWKRSGAETRVDPDRPVLHARTSLRVQVQVHVIIQTHLGI